jgi:hypothetical protein
LRSGHEMDQKEEEDFLKIDGGCSGIFLHSNKGFKYNKSEDSTDDREIFVCDERSCEAAVVRKKEPGTQRIIFQVLLDHDDEILHNKFCLQGRLLQHRVFAEFENRPEGTDSLDICEK